MPSDQTTNQAPEDLGISDEVAEELGNPPGAEEADAARADAQAADNAPASEGTASAPHEDGDEDDGRTSLQELAEADPRTREELLAELLEAEARRDEYLEDLRRARAEFDNYRKRMMREGTTQRAAGKAEVAEKLLDVLDDFDRTVDAAVDSEDEGLRKGVELVYSKLVEVLSGLGLSRIDETGVDFDPNRHEAVQRVAAADGDGDGHPVVHQVFRPGYELDGRVLRAAMVVVEQ